LYRLFGPTVLIATEASFVVTGLVAPPCRAEDHGVEESAEAAGVIDERTGGS